MFNLRMIFSRIILIFVSLFSFTLFICAEESSKEIHLGAILPMTGDYAQYGQELWRGMEIANSRLLSEGLKLKLTLEDGGTMMSQSSLTVANHLVENKGVQILAVLGADDIGPLISLSKRKKIPLLSLWDSSRYLRNLGEYVFSSGFSVEKNGAKIAELMMKDLRLNRVAMIGNNTNWSMTVSASFRKKYSKLGGEIVFDQSVDEHSTDFRSTILRLIQQKPNVIYLPFSLPSDLELFIKQFRNYGLEVPIFTGEAFVGDAMERLGSLTDNIYVTWLPESNSNLHIDYKSRFGVDPWDEKIAEVGFRGIMEIGQAIKSESGGTIISVLKKHFGESRSTAKELQIYKIKAGQLMSISQARATK